MTIFARASAPLLDHDLRDFMMADEALIDRIRTCFRSAFGTEPTVVTVEATPDDIEGWDSLGHAMLVNAVEQEFSLTLDIDDMMAMEDVQSVVSVVKGKLGA